MWKDLKTSEELEALVKGSHDKPVVIYKHSSRCGTSFIVRKRLEQDWNFDDGELDVYLLDLVAHRDVSNQVSDIFGVRHESPQVLVIRDGKSVFDTSHGGVSVDAIRKALRN